jgi:hypothetical protein
MLSFRISYPYLIKFRDVADRQPGGDDEASNEGATQAQQGMPNDFVDNSIIIIIIILKLIIRH